jgi:hypothetical protein
MQVYPSNLIGYWKREDTGAIYTFSPTHCIIRLNEVQKIYAWRIVTKNGASRLFLDNQSWSFVVMTNSFFSIRLKNSEVKTFVKTIDQE